MKNIFTVLLLCTFIAASSQVVKKTATPRQVITKIFKEYVKNEESVDGEDNKALMTKSFKSLAKSCQPGDFPILLNTWMYYDPTDFPTRALIQPIFIKYKTATIKAINNRIKAKKYWESKNRAPYSELWDLKKELSR
ncbi:hypothetical protein [Ferruginibacter sp. SUN106]|uniref:hypothetical protein n=1 Tax=Ferruginibacter sp. SUN106 TaxID=2978348 RepID=UPI003D365AB2